MHRSGHARIGEIPGTPGQNLLIRRLNMRMGAPQSRNAAVQIIAHGQLLTGGLGMKIDQRKRSPLRFFQNTVRRRKGIVAVVIQIDPALQADDADAAAAHIVIPRSAARRTGRIVGRSQQIAVFFQHRADLMFVKRMITQCDHIGPRIKDFLCLSGKQPQARGIFPVDHSEIHLFFPLQRPQPAHEKIQYILAHHISDRQHPKFHTVPPSR